MKKVLLDYFFSLSKEWHDLTISQFEYLLSFPVFKKSQNEIESELIRIGKLMKNDYPTHMLKFSLKRGFYCETDVTKLISHLNLWKITDPREIDNIVMSVFKENESLVNQVKAGNEKVKNVLISKVMKRANHRIDACDVMSRFSFI